MSAEKTKSIEQSLLELENITNKLESRDIALEEALELFENGTKLVGECRTRLAAAELKIKEIDVKSNDREK